MARTIKESFGLFSITMRQEKSSYRIKARMAGAESAEKSASIKDAFGAMLAFNELVALARAGATFEEIIDRIDQKYTTTRRRTKSKQEPSLPIVAEEEKAAEPEPMLYTICDDLFEVEVLCRKNPIAHVVCVRPCGDYLVRLTPVGA